MNDPRSQQLVRIELEMMKLESEQRSKTAEKKVLEEKSKKGTSATDPM